MCGRYVVARDSSELLGDFAASGDLGWEPAFSVAPKNRAPILRARDDERQLELAKWSFRPSWMKAGGPPNINARIETVATKPMFRGSFSSDRILVPMSGYYEWEEIDGLKQPWFIHGETPVLAAAGLRAAYQDDDGEWQSTFTIITREARDASGEVHDRMPAFLENDFLDTWLSPDKVTDKDGLLDQLDATSVKMAKTITTRPVSRRVNSVKGLDRTDATLIDEVEL